MCRAFAQERLRDSVTARIWTNVHEMYMHRAVTRCVDLGDADRLAVGLGEEHAAGVELPAHVGPLLVPGLAAEARRLRNLELELLPQLPQRRLVGGRGAANVHGVLAPVRR